MGIFLMKEVNRYSFSLFRIIFYVMILYIVNDAGYRLLSIILFFGFLIAENIYFYNEFKKYRHTEIKKLKHKVVSISDLENKRRLEISLILNAILLPIVYIGRNKKFKYMNDSFTKMFNEHLSNNNVDFEGIDVLHDLVYRAYLHEIAFSEEVLLEDKYYNIVFDPLFFNGYYDGMVMIFNDISHYKTNEQLQKNFIQDVSHELKTPIAAIKGASDILISNPNIDNELKNEFLEIISVENNRLQETVLDLIDITKIESLTFSKDLQLCNPVDICQDLINSFKVQSAHKQIKIIFKTIGSFQKYYIDIKRFKQILSNLIANAIHYTDQGYIEITLEMLEDELIIKVYDTGIGIEAKHLDQIFDRFYRVDRARARNSGGTGLGLAIVNSLVIALNGTITVESDGQSYTEFTIVFKF